MSKTPTRVEMPSLDQARSEIEKRWKEMLPHQGVLREYLEKVDGHHIVNKHLLAAIEAVKLTYDTLVLHRMLHYDTLIAESRKDFLRFLDL